MRSKFIWKWELVSFKLNFRGSYSKNACFMMCMSLNDTLPLSNDIFSLKVGTIDQKL